MRRVWFAPILLGLVLLAGCGGGGGGTSLPSPFAGSWTDGQGGVINVDGKGHVTGTASTTLSDGTPADGTWQGGVANDGRLSGTFQFTTITQTLSLAVSGGSNLGTDAHWRGTLVLTANGKTVSGPFDLTRQ